jgi:hypothetical protein
MLENIISQLSPDILAEAVRKNPHLVVNVLQKFETFQAFGSAMSTEQQIFLSNNLQSVNLFLKATDGKEYISMLLDAFKTFVENK